MRVVMFTNVLVSRIATLLQTVFVEGFLSSFWVLCKVYLLFFENLGLVLLIVFSGSCIALRPISFLISGIQNDPLFLN